MEHMVRKIKLKCKLFYIFKCNQLKILIEENRGLILETIDSYQKNNKNKKSI